MRRPRRCGSRGREKQVEDDVGAAEVESLSERKHGRASASAKAAARRFESRRREAACRCGCDAEEHDQALADARSPRRPKRI